MKIHIKDVARQSFFSFQFPLLIRIHNQHINIYDIVVKFMNGMCDKRGSLNLHKYQTSHINLASLKN